MHIRDCVAETVGCKVHKGGRLTMIAIILTEEVKIRVSYNICVPAAMAYLRTAIGGYSQQ